MQKGKNWDRQKDFHDWASAEGYYLNNGNQLEIAEQRYEEWHDIQEEDVDIFWQSSPEEWPHPFEAIDHG